MESVKTPRLLSQIDKEILKVILSPNDKHSSIFLTRKLGVPQTTIQRRRKRLENEFLESSYSLDLKKFGWRRVDLLIATRNGKTNAVAKELLSNEEALNDKLLEHEITQCYPFCIIVHFNVKFWIILALIAYIWTAFFSTTFMIITI